jgi:hypothetical protein
MYQVWGGERHVQGFGGVRNYLEHPGIDRRMDLQEVGCGSMDWIGLTQVVGTCECRNEPSGSIKCIKFLDWLKTG